MWGLVDHLCGDWSITYVETGRSLMWGLVDHENISIYNIFIKLNYNIICFVKLNRELFPNRKRNVRILHFKLLLTAEKYIQQELY